VIVEARQHEAKRGATRKEAGSITRCGSGNRFRQGLPSNWKEKNRERVFMGGGIESPRNKLDGMELVANQIRLRRMGSLEGSLDSSEPTNAEHVTASVPKLAGLEGEKCR